ncbi:MAG: ArnT family glycosyltransferase, partial [Chloroflexota bacterium]
MLVLLLAAAFRLLNVNWDSGQHLHPDERFITMVDTGIAWPSSIGQYFNSASSPLNPYNRGFGSFVYGTLPLFLIKAAATLLKRDTYNDVVLVGRVLSALSDVGSIWLLFLAGRRLYDSRVALLGSAFFAFSVLGVQLSHFMTVDTFTVFFLMISFYCAVRLMRGAGWGAAAGMGVAFGMAMACKLSIALVPVLMVSAIALRLIAAWPPEHTSGAGATDSRRAEGLVSGLLLLGVALAAAAVAFRVFQPYAFQGVATLSPRWIQDEAQQKAYISGVADVPFLLQWAHTTPIVFPLKDIVLWGMGWPLGLLSLAGLASATYQLLWHRRAIHLPAVAWIVANLAYLGIQQSKTMRYFYQLYPFLALLAGWLCVWLYERNRGRRFNWGTATGAVVLAASLLNVYAFTRIYTRPNTRVAASEWIYRHIPAGKTLAVEHWDDPLPLNLGHLSPNRYKQATLTLYDDDNQGKIDMIVKVLSQS